MGVLVIAEGKTFIFRSALFVGLGSVVATIIYLTPVPDQYPQSCSRTCHELDWPMICRVKLTLERYQTFSRACGGCPDNVTDCYGKYCVTGDGQKRGILTVNRQFPGPNLRVCQNDIIVVDVVNRIPGHSFGVHWRGQSQIESPYMDGVPMVTQCPIPSFTTFQYKFRATHAGTHMWQINTGEEKLETLFGGFVVRKPDSREIHRDLYDLEDPEHLIVIHSLTFPPKTVQIPNSNSVTRLVINGKVRENGAPSATFKVVPEKRYRFRVIVGGDITGCTVRLSVEDHELLVIALDGNPIKPRTVTSVRLAPGERLDFILRSDRPSSTYKIRAIPDKCETAAAATADLIYEGSSRTVIAEAPSTPKELSTVSDEECGKDGLRVCPEEVESLTPIPKALSVPDTRHTFYLFHAVRSVSSQTIYNTTFIAIEDTVKVPQTNNLTMAFPPSPLLTQSQDVRYPSFCSEDSVPEDCPKEVCECIHVLHIRLGATVELVLVNQDEWRDHVFHLHGYNFRLMGSTVLPRRMTPEEVRALDKQNKLLVRNFNNPIVKDTVVVPSNGVSVLRFKADNPGYWLLDEEHSTSWSRGMSVILRVGKASDLPEPPKDFPRCGNWVGPEYFLE
ncbi:UNVERIFIED_CONTAM: hypothetical protein PYX00_005342 [Menopon gallinae]|uniref:Uncharacterized protein n=1 Tax=Menopon gallinae TaxID=328185 RepID=A0AAW2HR04_9NEOP